MFVYTTAIRKLRKLTARKKIVQGGTSAGKTHGIIPILIDKATRNPRLKITVVAETIPAVKDGAADIFKDVMTSTNRWFEERWSANPMEYRFANGSRIQFKSFETVGKAKSAGKRDVLFLNEANHIPFGIADALMVRSSDIWIDFNPDEAFWVHTETMNDPDSEFIILTYKDNEAIPESIYNELMIKKERAKKSAYWDNWCRVYLDGEIGIPVVDNRFATEWDEKYIREDIVWRPEQTVYVSMDFNVEPFAFIYYHAFYDKTGFHFHILEEEEIKGGSIVEAAQRIRWKAHPWMHSLVITGDYNGNARNLSGGTYYEQLARELAIPMRRVQTTPNITHKESRNNLNYVLFHNPDFGVRPECVNTIRDLRFVEANGDGSIKKENRKDLHQRADFMDAVRYAVEHKAVKDWIKSNQKRYI